MVKISKRAAVTDGIDEQPIAKKSKKVSITEPTIISKKPPKTTSFAGKSKHDTKKKPFPKSGSKEKPPQPAEAPPDWGEFKKMKKEVREARKKSKSFYETVTEAKKIGENLRRKNLKGGKAERTKLAAELHELLGQKGNYVKFVVSHDMARIVQHLLKFGSPAIREEVAKELIPSALTLIQSKYAKFCVERMFKYGTAETRAALINTFYGAAVKLCSHASSASIIANAYATWATPKQRQHLQQEFYGDMFRQAKDDSLHCIADVYKDSPDMKVAIIGAVKANLTRVLGKELLDNQLIHAVIADYLSVVTDAADRAEIITSLSPHAVVLANTKEGSRIVMNCIWHGTHKDKKIIMKALKEHLKDICCHEYAHTVIIAILDAVDDTVLVVKILLGGIISHATTLSENEWGRKILLWIVAPTDPHHFHPTFINELKSGLESATCKKEPKIRRAELLAHATTPLLKQIAENPHKWLASASIAMVTLPIIKSSSGNAELASTLKSICTYICDPQWTVTEKSEDQDCQEAKPVAGIEHAGLHMMLKKLAQHDKSLLETDSASFGQALVESITPEVIKKFVSTNRGCFLLVTVYESSCDDVKNRLTELLQKKINSLKKQKTTGAKILYKKITT